MGLVDKHNDRSGATFDFVHHALEPAFELAFDTRTRLQQTQVQGQQADLGQTWRYVTGCDAQGQAFDHRCFADSGLTGKDRVVLPAAAENVNHLANLAVTSEHRVELAAEGLLGQVNTVTVQIGRGAGAPVAGALLTVACRTGIGKGQGLLRFGGLSGDGVQITAQCLFVYSCKSLEPGTGLTAQFFATQQGCQQMAAAQARLTKIDRGAEPGRLKQGWQLGRQGRGAVVAAFQTVQGALEFALEHRLGDAEMLEDPCQVGVRGVEQLEQQVLDLDIVVGARQAQSSRSLHGVLADRVKTLDQCTQIHRHDCSPVALKRNSQCSAATRRRFPPGWPASQVLQPRWVVRPSRIGATWSAASTRRIRKSMARPVMKRASSTAPVSLAPCPDAQGNSASKACCDSGPTISRRVLWRSQ
ncbi:hypothetical protein D3C84_483720 [compost metagenome]